MAWDLFPEEAVQKEVLRFTGSEFAPVCLLDQEHMEYDCSTQGSNQQTVIAYCDMTAPVEENECKLYLSRTGLSESFRRVIKSPSFVTSVMAFSAVHNSWERYKWGDVASRRKIKFCQGLFNYRHLR